MQDLEKRVLRLKAISAAQRIMAAYSYYLSGAQFQSILDLFSADEGIAVTMPWGTYCGPEEVKKLYFGLYQNMLCANSDNGLQPGVVLVHGMNTPTIEIAEDGMSASGTWNSPGLFTVRDPEGANGLQSYWAWQKTSADFVLDHGEWKIQMLKAEKIFTTPFETSWTDYQGDPYRGISAAYLPGRTGRSVN